MADTIEFRLGDATRLADCLRLPSETPTHVVVNPPYGVRMRPKGVGQLYRSFLASLSEVAPGCTLVLITAARGTFRRASEAAGVEILAERRILHGELKASIFTCRV